jgi:hypothetical protein
MEAIIAVQKPVCMVRIVRITKAESEMVLVSQLLKTIASHIGGGSAEVMDGDRTQRNVRNDMVTRTIAVAAVKIKIPQMLMISFHDR